jgi:hypothetical protein
VPSEQRRQVPAPISLQPASFPRFPVMAPFLLFFGRTTRVRRTHNISHLPPGPLQLICNSVPSFCPVVSLTGAACAFHSSCPFYRNIIFCGTANKNRARKANASCRTKFGTVRECHYFSRVSLKHPSPTAQQAGTPCLRSADALAGSVPTSPSWSMACSQHAGIRSTTGSVQPPTYDKGLVVVH